MHHPQKQPSALRRALQIGALWLACATAAASAAGYDYVTIQVEGGLATQASGISTDGTIVGSYQQPQGRHSVVTRPFRWRDGKITTFDSLEPAAHSFDDINEQSLTWREEKGVPPALELYREKPEPIPPPAPSGGLRLVKS